MENGNKQKTLSVAVFDSGIGGLNLLYACVARMRNVHFYYVADNYNVPYGNKTKEEVLALTETALAKLNGVNLSAALIACNTVTALCIDRLRERYPFPVVGIQPAIKPAACAGGKLLVLATRATVGSPSFKSLCRKYGGDNTRVCACDLLAKFVEDNVMNLPQKLPEGLFPKVEADAVVLGCTHYLFVKKHIQRVYNCPVYDGISGTVNHLAEILGTADHFLENLGTADHSEDFGAKITYIGGNIAKNEAIFKLLVDNS